MCKTFGFRILALVWLNLAYPGGVLGYHRDWGVQRELFEKSQEKKMLVAIIDLLDAEIHRRDKLIFDQ